MNRWLWGLLCLLTTSVGCGEAEVIELPTRPDRATFNQMQRTLIAIGCSAGGCHSVLIGDFKATEFPKTPADSEEEYILTKPFVDLDEAENSVLIRTALKDDPLALGHPICFANFDSCSARRILAWINYAGEGDQTLDEACPEEDVIDNACFMPL